MDARTFARCQVLPGQFFLTKFFLAKFFVHRVFRACRRQRYCAVNRRAQRSPIFLMPEGDSRVAGYRPSRFGGVRNWLTWRVFAATTAASAGCQALMHKI
jgi:hypothetical protein